MPTVLDQLVTLLALERIEENLFRGQSQDLGWARVYGGQVLGQALSAAVQTVPAERHVHSLHAYFLRPGEVNRPIVYDVDRIRDGGSFTTRRVVAIQGGHAIFNMAASFQKIEPGLEHQDVMPEAPLPETLPTLDERYAAHAARLAKDLAGRKIIARPFDVRTADPVEDPFAPSKRPPARLVWLKTIERLPDDPALHHYLLAYASDYAFVTTIRVPYEEDTLFGRTYHACASQGVDHALINIDPVCGRSYDLAYTSTTHMVTATVCCPADHSGLGP
ncbi:MAG: acyl-CoA thioesterase domain-containing protein [Minicystis sp.]